MNVLTEAFKFADKRVLRLLGYRDFYIIRGLSWLGNRCFVDVLWETDGGEESPGSTGQGAR